MGSCPLSFKSKEYLHKEKAVHVTARYNTAITLRKKEGKRASRM